MLLGTNFLIADLDFTLQKNIYFLDKKTTYIRSSDFKVKLYVKELKSCMAVVPKGLDKE